MTKVLEFQLNHQSFQCIFSTDCLQDRLVGSPCRPRDSQESSPTPPFKSINFLWCSAFFIVQLSHPHMTTGKVIALTKQTFVGKVMPLLFKYAIQVGHGFSSKEQVSFNFMAAVTICSDSGTQENKVCPCFHCLRIHFP